MFNSACREVDKEPLNIKAPQPGFPPKRKQEKIKKRRKSKMKSRRSKMKVVSLPVKWLMSKTAAL